jgi:hypothetical protein
MSSADLRRMLADQEQAVSDLALQILGHVDLDKFDAALALVQELRDRAFAVGVLASDLSAKRSVH